MKYISVEDLQNFCDNNAEHSVTPNDFMRMYQIEIVRCKDCKCYEKHNDAQGFCTAFSLVVGAYELCAKGEENE